jgi:PHP domain
VKRRRLAILVLLLGVAAYATHIALWRPLAVAGPAPADGYVRVPGVVHVHTTLSDGGGTPSEVITAARAAGLAFVVITDHNNLDAKAEEGDRTSKKITGANRLLVIVGTEVSTNAGHVLGLGIEDPTFRFSGDVYDALEDIHDLGGVAFAAHPLSQKSELLWSGWDQPGGWGIELLNGDSQWRAAGWLRLARTAALYGLNHRYALLGSLTAPDETLSRWDTMLAQRDVPGIAGADAHSRVLITRNKALRFPSYEALFTLARNYVLLDAPLTGGDAADSRAIIDALGRGRSYIGLDALAPAGGFTFVAERGTRRWTMGDTVPAGAGLRLHAGGALPAGARVRLLRDGQVLVESEGEVSRFDAEPGIYRVEVRVPGWDVPWVISNPIAVLDEMRIADRALRAQWPATPPDPTSALPPVTRAAPIPIALDAFSAEADPTSSAHREIEPGSGMRLEFRLAAPTAAQPDTFCALVDRTLRAFPPRDGVTLRIKADGVYRIWMQVRDENLASSDGGTEWWAASIKTSPEWRDVRLPFRRFRSINPRTDGRLDLDKVRALVFVLDRGAVKPGTAGSIWIDGLTVY